MKIENFIEKYLPDFEEKYQAYCTIGKMGFFNAKNLDDPTSKLQWIEIMFPEALENFIGEIKGNSTISKPKGGNRRQNNI